MLTIALTACLQPTEQPTESTTEPEPDRVARGWEVLRYGDFVGSGVPADLWFDLRPAGSNLLDRTGRSADLERSYNLFPAPNGVEVVGGLTCFGCHAAEVDGVFYPGVGDPRVDFTGSGNQRLLELAQLAVQNAYGTDSPEWMASEPFFRGALAVSDYVTTPFAGVNPAFSLERAAVANRDPESLEWLSEPEFDIPETTIWSDTPPWWHLQKRSHLYWTGFGTGEVERLLMQISVVAITDVAQAESILTDFPDIVAWIDALEPPPYPGEIDGRLADEGQAVFEATCSPCHGTYGDVETYPDQVIALAEVGTDPTYAEAFDDTPFVQWLADSWFGSGQGGPPEVLGYVAPPLDGIWVTAPYFHNGSVPDLASVIDPSLRPARWRRDPTDTTLDHDRMGWPYTEPAEADAWTYDTTVPGASSDGHRFGAALSDSDQRAVLEYLKTL